MLDNNSSHSDTATDTVMEFVNITLEGNRQQDAMLPSWSCLVHTVDRFDSEGWFSCAQVIFLMCFVFLVKNHAAFK